MKKFIIVILFLFLFFSLLPFYTACEASAPAKTHPPDIQNITDELEKNYGISVEIIDNPPEFRRWSKGLEGAIYSLPKNVSSEIIMGGNSQRQSMLNIVFEKQDTWSTGSIDPEANAIIINTTPNPRHPFSFEYVSENGYMDQEIIYVFLHEMGHLWDYQSSILSGVQSSYSLSYQKIIAKERSPSSYAYYHRKAFSDEVIRLDTIIKQEDFAESFAFYILLPEYMKINFPLRYNWLKDNVFQTEYEGDIYPIPSSMKTRLTKSLTKDG